MLPVVLPQRLEHDRIAPIRYRILTGGNPMAKDERTVAEAVGF